MSAPGRCRAGDGGLELTRDARGIARHLMDCESCYGRLDAYRDESDGLLRIREAQRERTPPLVDHVLAAAHKNGEQELADLLVDLVRACISLAPAGAIHRRLVREPRPFSELSKGAIEVGRRLSTSGVGRSVDIAELAPSEERALAVADGCLDLLEMVEGGPSDRCRLGRALVRLHAGRVEEAALAFDTLSKQAGVSSKVKSLAELNLLPAWIAMGRYADVIDSASRLLEKGDDRNVLFCLATAYAWCGETDRVLETAERYSRVGHGEIDPDFWNQLVEDEAPWFSEKTHLPIDRIRDAFLGASTTEV